jgi:hypothetical protein
MHPYLLIPFTYDHIHIILLSGCFPSYNTKEKDYSLFHILYICLDHLPSRLPYGLVTNYLTSLYHLYRLFGMKWVNHYMQNTRK